MNSSSLIAIPFGDLNSPLPFPEPPHCMTKFPNESNFCTVSNMLSTTKTYSFATAIPDGCENSPGPEPCEPHDLI